MDGREALSVLFVALEFLPLPLLALVLCIKNNPAGGAGPSDIGGIGGTRGRLPSQRIREREVPMSGKKDDDGLTIVIEPGQEAAFLRALGRQVRALNAKLAGPPRKKNPGQ